MMDETFAVADTGDTDDERAATAPSTETPKTSGAALPGGPAEALGQVVGLMMASPAHKHLFLADLEWLIVPPILLRLFRLFRRDNVPIGFASWAFLTEDAEARLTSGTRKLSPGDWNAGDHAWLIDVVAPFGGAERMVKEVKDKIFPDRKLKTLQPAPDGRGMAVVEW